MKKVNDITEELDNLGSTLGAISRAMPYAVPVGYFENLPGDVLKKAGEGNEVSEMVPAWSKVTPYATPHGYFTGLATDILNAVKAEHVTAASSTEVPYSVPAGFFETFPGKMLQAAKSGTPAKKETTRIPLSKPNPFRQIRWAAAAVMLICIGFGTYHTVFNQQSVYSEKMLASVPDNEIQDYLQHTYILDVNRIIDNTDINEMQVENKDIIQYLNETGWDMTE